MRGRPITKAIGEAILKRYAAGESSRMLARTYMLTEQGIRGYAARKGHGRGCKNRRYMDLQRERDIVQALRDGTPIRAIVRKFFTSTSAIRKIRIKNNILARPTPIYKRIPAEVEAGIVRDYVRGEKIEVIAFTYGIHRTLVWRIAVTRNGVPARAKGGSYRRIRPRSPNSHTPGSPFPERASELVGESGGGP